MRLVNRHLVGVRGDGGVSVLSPPKPGELMTAADALAFAAWLVMSATLETGFDQTQADAFAGLVREMQEGK